MRARISGGRVISAMALEIGEGRGNFMKNSRFFNVIMAIIQGILGTNTLINENIICYREMCSL